MAGSVNKAILVGNLGRDPESRHTSDGRLVVTFSVATSEHWRDKASGERKERTEWHSVVIFNENLAKIAEQYLKKGSKVYVEGAIQSRTYTDKNAVERRATEIVLSAFNGTLTLLDKAERQAPDPDSYGQRRTPPASSSTSRMSDAIDDDIPF